MDPNRLRPAPAWEVERWLNVQAPLSLEALRGRVIVLLAFQMRCAGCVQLALPQLRRVCETFEGDKVAAIGLHTVFEDHEAMRPEALEGFLQEHRFDFPVGVDRADRGDGMPLTMQRYQMQGTPTLVLIDAQGRLRRQAFGHQPDLRLGAEIMALSIEAQQSEDLGSGLGALGSR